MDRPAGVVDFEPSDLYFPFESRWFDSSVGPVHYIDQGAGRPLLLLHGNPDWSFLYRKIISGIDGRFRCIAPDYPGFGLSAHPPAPYRYTPAEHAAVVGELVERLDLQDAVVMGQDWGGPIGMDIASRMPERFSGLVMGNTWFWPADDIAMRAFSLIMGSAPLQMLIRRRNLFVTTVMKRTLQAKLTDTEFAAMAEHTIIGERIISHIEYLAPIAHVIRSAHERWDGRGYPDCLRAEEIPLGSRILLVCDAYHAMTSDRPYRKALPDDVALDELRRNTGSQFDPRVVDAFFDAWPHFDGGELAAGVVSRARALVN